MVLRKMIVNQYYNVDSALFQQLQQAPSKGKFLTRTFAIHILTLGW
ncbi:KTSC domain-containing protein [Rhizobium leguminosarum]